MLQLNRLKLRSIVFDKTQEDWIQIHFNHELKFVRQFWNKIFTGYPLDEKSIFLAFGNYEVDYSHSDYNKYRYLKSCKNSKHKYLFSIYGKPGYNSPYDEIFWFKFNKKIYRIKYIHQLQNILDYFDVDLCITGKLSINF